MAIPVGPTAALPAVAPLFPASVSGKHVLSEIFARVHEARELGTLRSVNHHFDATVQDDMHHLLSLAEVTTIDNATVERYRRRMHPTPTFEEALVACLKAKQTLRSSSRNKPLYGVELSDCTLTRELIDGFKTYGTGLRQVTLTNADIPAGQSDGFGEILSGMIKLEALTIRNVDFNEVLDLSSMPRLSRLEFENCSMLQQLPNIPRANALNTLKVRGCPKITSLSDLQHAGVLKKLRISNCSRLSSISMIPDGLESLDITNCPSITMLPALPATLKALELFHCSCLRATPLILPGSQLTKYTLTSCPEIVLPPDLAHAKALKHLFVEECCKLTAAPTLPEGSILELFYIGNCPSITESPDITPARASLKRFALTGCSGLRTAPVVPLSNALQYFDIRGSSVRWPIGWTALRDGALLHSEEGLLL